MAAIVAGAEHLMRGRRRRNLIAIKKEGEMLRPRGRSGHPRGSGRSCGLLTAAALKIPPATPPPHGPSPKGGALTGLLLCGNRKEGR